MKKTMMQLAVTGLVLACATTLFAGSTTSWLQAGDCMHVAEGGTHAKAYGYVVLKATGRGYDVTYQVWNAAPSYSYYAQTAGQFFGYLKTDAKGRGTLTVRVNTDPKTWGNWIGLRQTDGHLTDCGSDALPPFVPQSLLAAPNPFNPPTAAAR